MYGRSSTGLMCSWGSSLDANIARPKMPKRALPPDIRRKVVRALPTEIDQKGDRGYHEQDHANDPSQQDPDASFWNPGFGVHKQRGHNTSEYCAGNQKHFLRAHSGTHMATRIPHNRDSTGEDPMGRVKKISSMGRVNKISNASLATTATSSASFASSGQYGSSDTRHGRNAAPSQITGRNSNGPPSDRNSGYPSQPRSKSMGSMGGSRGSHGRTCQGIKPNNMKQISMDRMMDSIAHKAGVKGAPDYLEVNGLQVKC